MFSSILHLADVMELKLYLQTKFKHFDSLEAATSLHDEHSSVMRESDFLF